MGIGAREAVARSVNDRLKALSKKDGFETRLLQIHYVSDAFLRRLVASEHAGSLVLKGGMLMMATGERHRPTEDIDLHMTSEPSATQIVDILQHVASLPPTAEDGIDFRFTDLKISQIREGFIPGYRVFFTAYIGQSPVRMKFDICFGDAVLPAPVLRSLPPVLSGDPVEVLAYPWETVIAEKVHAMVEFGMDATRLKDFYDLAVLARMEEIDGSLATQSMIASFRERGTEVTPYPIALSDSFISARARDFSRWAGKKGPLRQQFADLQTLVTEVREMVVPICEAAAGVNDEPGIWLPGEGWSGMRNMIAVA